jgi:hypothetical protein
MTREEFAEKLRFNYYSYRMEGNKVVVTDSNTIMFTTLDSIPSDVEFNSGGPVYLYSIKDLPYGVIFNNRGDVILDSLKSISRGVEFNNEGDVRLNSLIYTSEGSNGWNYNWEGNIKGVDSKRLINAMIKQGLFER